LNLPEPTPHQPLPRWGVAAFLVGWPLVLLLGWTFSESVRTHVPHAFLPLIWIFAFGLFLRQFRA
jgi:hypothetical protein